MNGFNKMVTIDTKHQKREESNNMGLGKIGSKHLETEVGQHIMRNKLKEDLQIMWHKAKLLQMSERESYQN